MPKTTDPMTRLVARSAEEPCLVPGVEFPCWAVQNPAHSAGYGLVSVNGKNEYAHRVAYRFMVGEIPEGLELDHRCYNPACWNPWHTEAVSHRENLRRRRWAYATHCPQGHEYTPENTYQAPDRPSQRECRVCRAGRYDTNKEEINKRRRARDKEKINERRRAYREANREKINAAKQAYREANKDKINANHRAWKAAKKAAKQAEGS